MCPEGCSDVPPDFRSVDYLGWAWDDAASLQVALIDLAAEPGWSGEGQAVPRESLIVERHAID